MKRNATAIWNGTLKQGGGKLSSGSGVLHETAYTFRSRFEDGRETNPEELIAAAHAGCFSMALSLKLEQAGAVPESIETRATVTLDPNQLAITTIELDCQVKAGGISPEQFQKVAEDAKANCPVSKVLNAAISLDARLI